jgi:hypothetical protein
MRRTVSPHHGHCLWCFTHPDASLSGCSCRHGLRSGSPGMRGEIMGIVRWNDQANRWIDGLSTVPRLLVWAVLSLIAALTLVLVEYLISGSFVGWRGMVPFVIVGTASGYAGSTIRNPTAGALEFDALPNGLQARAEAVPVGRSACGDRSHSTEHCRTGGSALRSRSFTTQ